MDVTPELITELEKALEFNWNTLGGSIEKIAFACNVSKKFIWEIKAGKLSTKKTIKDENVQKFLDECKIVYSQIPSVDPISENVILTADDFQDNKYDDAIVEHIDSVEQLRLIKAEALAAIAAYNAAVQGAKEYNGEFVLIEHDGDRAGELQIMKLTMRKSI